jgi:hypothetical protein
VSIDQDRGTGRTTKQLKEAPQGAVFLVRSYSMAQYTRRLALYLKRNDISVQPLQWLHSDSWLGRKHYVIVDHDVVPDEKEQHYLRIIRERPP